MRTRKAIRNHVTDLIDESYNKGYEQGARDASMFTLIKVEHEDGKLTFAFRFGEDNIKEIPQAIIDSLREGV